jgi:hypothetical protein
MFKTSYRSSTCAKFIWGDILRGMCQVTFKSGATVEYHNVSRRALLNLMLNPNLSYGFWINDNLLSIDNNAVAVGYLPEYMGIA